VHGSILLGRISYEMVMAVIGLIAAFGVFNTMLMSVLERTREFGVLLSLGMTPRQVAMLVPLEGLLIGGLGATLGLGVGVLLSLHAIHVGVDYGAFTGADAFERGGLVLDSVLKGAWDPVRMTIYYLAAIAFCVLAAAYPAWTISRLQPAKAMRPR